MKGTWKVGAAASIAFALAIAAPAVAAVDGEVELRYWNNEVEIGGDAGGDMDSAPGAGLRVEIVLIKRLALAGEYFKLVGEGDLEETEFTQGTLDAKWRIIAPSRNTFFAVGLGYLNYEVDSEGEKFDTSAYRIMVDGRFGFIKILYVYGRLAYLPSISDLTVDGFTFAEGDTGYDVEVGLGIEPIPILSLWVGYRAEKFDFKEPGGGSGRLSFESSGAFFGAGIHF